MADWKEIPVVTTKKRGLVKLMGIGVIILLVGAGIGVLLQPPLSELFGAQPGLWAPENAREMSTKIAAVDSQGNGVLADLRVQVRVGEGKVWTDVIPKKEIDLQYSAELAVQVASEVVGADLSRTDVFITIVAPAEIVGGPSAGAAMAASVIAAIENRTIKSDVVITGEIRADHRIGEVGGIYAKAKAANDAGMSLFLVPPGQSKVTVYQQIEIAPRFYYYQPTTIDLNQYAEDAGWGLQIQEVSTIQDAIELMLE